MKYSLIVPYFKTPEITRLCLYSIFKFARGNPEVVLIDNAPDSPESRMLAEFPKITIISNGTQAPGSRAHYGALDLGLARASHDLIGLIHSDTIFLKDGWDLECFSRVEKLDLAALGTFEREANPFRPLRKRLKDAWRHWRHQRWPAAQEKRKLMTHFVLTRKSTLARTGIVFLRDAGSLNPSHFAGAARPVEVLSLTEISRFLWHTSNITSLLTGQMSDPKLVAGYREKRASFINNPRIRELFGPVLPKE